MTRILILAGLLLTCWAATPTAQPTRFVYLTPVDGAGTDADPYQSRCHGMPHAGNIDLRPLGIDRWLCASDTLPADLTGVQQLGSALGERVQAARKTALDTIVKRQLSATTVDGVISELLTPHLRAGRDGKVKIYLGDQEPVYQRTAWVPFEDGGLVADATNAASAFLEPSLAWATTLATETFTATNGDLDGCQARGCTHTWVEYFGTAPTIASNVVIGTGATINDARLDADLATDDMEVSAQITAFVNSNQARCGVLSRKDSSSTRTAYIAQGEMDATPANDRWRLAKRVAGTFTSLSSASTSPAVNDVVKLRSDGSSHSLYVNGALTVGPTTDTDITGNTRVGITIAGNGASDSCSLDNVIAYDYPLPTTRRAPILWFN